MPLLFRFSACCALVLAAGILPRAAHAIMVYGPQGRNTSAPTGLYADSGWQYAGFIGNNLSASWPNDARDVAWPVAPRWALRAKHTFGSTSTGYTIYQNGVYHYVINALPLAGTDLVLVQVDQDFTSVAPLYNGNDDIGKEIMVFGTGFSVKGAEVHAEGTNRFNGWSLNNNAARAYSWGRNLTEGNVNVFGTDTLYSTFDAPTLSNGDPNPHSAGLDEAMAGFGDSGGGVFIKQGGQWRIAGITYAIDSGVYLTQNGSTPDTGAIFDARDLWTQATPPQSGRVLITDPNPVPLGFYASRLSTYSNWINVTIVPEAGTLGLIAGGVGVAAGMGLLCRRTFRTGDRGATNTRRS